MGKVELLPILEMSFTNGSNETLFRTLIQNAFENSGYSTFSEITFDKKLHGSSLDFLDLRDVYRGDLIVRRSKNNSFDKDAFIYTEFKVRVYGDFNTDGGLNHDHSLEIWKDAFLKLRKYKLRHPTSNCFFSLITYGLEMEDELTQLHRYKKANVAKRVNFETFCSTHAKKMGLTLVHKQTVLPRVHSANNHLHLDIAFFSIDNLDESAQDTLIQEMFPNILNDFKDAREKFYLSLIDLDLHNFLS